MVSRIRKFPDSCLLAEGEALGVRKVRVYARRFLFLLAGAAIAGLVLVSGASEAVRVPQQIVFTTDRHAQPPPATSNLELYLMNADGSGQRRLTRNAASDDQPVWSRDGGQIAFVRSVRGDEAIYVVNADGTGARRLSPSRAHDGGPAWSPDGKRIAFVRGGDLWTMAPDGRGAKRLTSGPENDGAMTWSPDGRRIAFSSEVDGDSDLYTVRADGSARRRLASGPGSDLRPAWSPDGKTIAFNSDRDGGMQLYLVNADGTNVRQLAFHPSCNEFPSWSPDGGRIVFTTNRDAGGGPNCAGPWEIYVTNIDGSSVRRLTNNTAYDWTSAGSWRPAQR